MVVVVAWFVIVVFFQAEGGIRDLLVTGVQTCALPIYGSGIPWEGTVLDVALEKKIVQKAGSYFSFGDERLGQGRQNATSFLAENPDIVQQILAQVQAEAPEEQIISARLLPAAPHAERAVDVP